MSGLKREAGRSRIKIQAVGAVGGVGESDGQIGAQAGHTALQLGVGDGGAEGFRG